MNMNCGEDYSCCYFHPKEASRGVCPQCLNERLLVLAAKQAAHLPSARGTHKTRALSRTNFPKIFAFGSLLNRLEFRHSKSVNSDDHEASSSQEDSFISIKFEDNGVSSWEKGTVSNKVSLEQFSNKSWNHDLDKNTKQEQDKKEGRSVIEHAKPRASLRWRKRIGHLFHLIRWKRSNKTNVRHVGTRPEGVKVRKSWIRNLTKRRTKE